MVYVEAAYMQDISVRHMVLRKYYARRYCLEHMEVYKGYAGQLCPAFGYEEVS